MKTVFYDIDTQFDFLLPAGALYVPGAERILPAIVRLNQHAASRGIPVISTTDAHTEDDPEFKIWPHHCVAGTLGQRKPETTLLLRRVVVPNRDCGLEIEGVQQIIVEKQTVDVFAVPNMGRAIERLQPERHVVYGVVTEICVLYAVRGLVKTGKPVLVLTDAIRGLNDENSSRALAEIEGLGARLVTSDQL